MTDLARWKLSRLPLTTGYPLLPFFLEQVTRMVKRPTLVLTRPSDRRTRSHRRRLLACSSLMMSLCITGHTTATADAQTARGDDGASIKAVKRLGPRTLDLTIWSPAMRADMPVRIILPKSWHKTTKRTFPVLYLLQGASDDYTSWTRETDVEALAKNADLLVVMPSGGRAGFYSNWWDHGSSTAPRWETFHTVEVRQLMERAYRAGRERAVIGLSEGGLGALNYAARHPGTYRFVGSFSGIVDIADPIMQLGIVATCLRENTDPLRIWGHPDEQRKIWDAHNPSRMIGKFRNTWVHLYAADGTQTKLDKSKDPLASLLEQPLPKPTAKFAKKLRSAGVKVTINVSGAGTHSWPYWERELHNVWPSVLASLKVNRNG